MSSLESVTRNLSNVCNIYKYIHTQSVCTKYDLTCITQVEQCKPNNTKLYSHAAHLYITLNKCIVHITKLNTAYSACEVTLKSFHFLCSKVVC